jgi:VIT family/Protein of unknown function (DUF3309)
LSAKTSTVVPQRQINSVSIGLILVIILIIFLLGGFSGRFGGYGYGYGHGGIGVIGVILIILIVCFFWAGFDLTGGIRMSRLPLYPESHFINRIGWLRAVVLGANDGILSTASLIVGVAAAAATQNEVLLAAVAGLVAGAMSMAAGEYVSVSSQSDTEQADLAREHKELSENPTFSSMNSLIFYARGAILQRVLPLAGINWF